jgi:hypothetical protein
LAEGLRKKKKRKDGVNVSGLLGSGGGTWGSIIIIAAFGRRSGAGLFSKHLTLLSIKFLRYYSIADSDYVSPHLAVHIPFLNRDHPPFDLEAGLVSYWTYGTEYLYEGQSLPAPLPLSQSKYLMPTPFLGKS